jgi:hypothetical protein
MNFELNIENYNKNELREMFELPENYNKNMTNTNTKKLIDNIKNNKNINENTREKTIDFLNKAKNILIRDMNLDSNSIQDNIENIKERAHKVTTTLTDFYNINYDLKTTELQNPEQHMVQVDSHTPFNLSYPSPYFKGIINPLKRRTRVENLIIDTRFRENYYNSSPTNFNLQLPMVIENVFTMQLSAIELPNTFYTISKQYNNNFFSIIINYQDGISEGKVITIPDGNYDYTSLQASINNQLYILEGNFQYINFLINISNNNGSGQMMVGIDSEIPSSVEISSLELNFQADRFGYDDRNTPLPLKLGWLMGFRNGIYTNNLNYVSEAVVDVTGPRYLYLVVDDFNNSNNNGLFYTAFNSSLLNKNTIGRISLQSQLFSILIENNNNLITTPREYFGPVNIRNLQIQLLDEYGRIVDLNYMDFSFSLTLTIKYDI